MFHLVPFLYTLICPYLRLHLANVFSAILAFYKRLLYYTVGQLAFQGFCTLPCNLSVKWLTIVQSSRLRLFLIRIERKTCWIFKHTFFMQYFMFLMVGLHIESSILTLCNTWSSKWHFFQSDEWVNP